MAPASTQEPPATKQIVPPEERFWKRYSPHFELPLAGVTSFFVHAFVLGLLVLGGFAYLFKFNQEAQAPPKMDVVALAEGPGGGPQGLSGEPGLPGSPDGGPKTEVAVGDPLQPDAPPTPSGEPAPELQEAKNVELAVPTVDVGLPAVSGDVLADLEKTAQEADARVKQAIAEAQRAKALKQRGSKQGSGKVNVAKVGTGNPNGTGGLGGGKGPGFGKGKGPGMGKGGYGGRPATKQEILAYRWRFDLSGTPKQHADKLATIGFTVAVPDAAGNFHVIKDLKRRPAVLQPDDLGQFRDAVKWYNTKPESVMPLARELGLPFVPQYVVLFLPKDREEKMYQAEERYAQQFRRDLRTVRATWFDFRLQGGSFEPLA